MATTNIGYDGSVGETEWALIAPSLGATYTVETETDWAPTIGPGTRQVIVSAGAGTGYGVRSSATDPETVTLGAVSSGSRWDLVVKRRSWAGTGGTTTLAVVPGSASRQIPARTQTPGTVDDQPIALARVASGSSTIAELIDLRVWTQNGGAYAKDEMVLSYLDEVGTQVCIGNTLWQRGINVTGNATWMALTNPVQHQRLGAAVSNINLAAPGASGLPIIKTGQVTDTGRDAFGNQYLAKVVFTSPFPNGLMTVQITPIEVAASNPATVSPSQPISVDEASRTGFSAMVPRTAAGTTRSYMWMAIGF